MQRKRRNKEKIGTVLDRQVVKKVKELSVKEGRTISDIIQDAILKYDELRHADENVRKSAVERFCSKPFNLKGKEIKELLDEDYFEQ
jgi:hypothetical protein